MWLFIWKKTYCCVLMQGPQVMLGLGTLLLKLQIAGFVEPRALIGMLPSISAQLWQTKSNTAEPQRVNFERFRADKAKYFFKQHTVKRWNWLRQNVRKATNLVVVVMYYLHVPRQHACECQALGITKGNDIGAHVLFGWPLWEHNARLGTPLIWSSSS